MIIDFKNKLVFIATSKTASTSIEKALIQFSYCGLIGKHPRLKHMNFKTFVKIKKGLGLGGFKTWCVVRHPVEKSISWYNYRRREKIKDKDRFLGDISYKEYLTVLDAKGRNECNDATSIIANNNKTVDLVFDYSRPNELLSFLDAVYGIPELPRHNVSASYGETYQPSEDELRFARQVLHEEISNFEDIETTTADQAKKLMEDLKI